MIMSQTGMKMQTLLFASSAVSHRRFSACRSALACRPVLPLGLPKSGVPAPSVATSKIQEQSYAGSLFPKDHQAPGKIKDFLYLQQLKQRTYFSVGKQSYLCERCLSSPGCGGVPYGGGHGQKGGGWEEKRGGQLLQRVAIHPALKLLHAPAERQRGCVYCRTPHSIKLQFKNHNFDL